MRLATWASLFAGAAGQIGEEGGLVPLPDLPRAGGFPGEGLGGLAHDAGDEGLQIASGVLPDLHGQHFGRVHLLVQELYDPPQLGWDGVRDEEEADLAGLEVGLDPLPEVSGGGGAVEEGGELLLRVEAFFLAALREPGLEGVRRPVEDGIRGVVEHLADDFPAGAGIAASLDFDQGGDAVLIQEEVVQGPAGAALLLVRDTHFAGDQEPAARRAGIDLVPREQVGMAGEEVLEIKLCALYRKKTGGFRHLRELPGGVKQEDSSRHWIGFQWSLLEHGSGLLHIPVLSP